MTSGNHELYKQNTSESEFLVTVPDFKDNYLASNIDIIDPETQELVPLAERYKKFTTKIQGIRIVAFGFLFDFTGNYNNTVVQRVEDTILEEWFQKAIREQEVDLFLVAGHVPAHSPEYKAIFKAIRSIRPDIPIQFFGGHEHIRDYAIYDEKAVSLASGRFMETIGFMSIDGLSTKNRPTAGRNPVFKRRYIDNNLHSFYHHTSSDKDTFHTEKGINVSRLIAESRTTLELDKIYGCVPRDLWMSRRPYPHDASVYTWLEQDVLVDLLSDESRMDRPAVAVVNTGAIRFDVFKGSFTQDTVWTISPFTNQFRFVKDVPYGKVQLIMDVLNKQTKVVRRDDDAHGGDVDALAPPAQVNHRRWLDSEMDGTQKILSEALAEQSDSGEVIPGYTTTDDAGDDGDDTIHSSIPYYRVPNCIQALISANESIPETVDLVYNEFIEPYLTLAAKFAGLDVDFGKEGESYMAGVTMTDLILRWVKKNWPCDDSMHI